MNNKIKFLKEKFSEHKYTLNNVDIADLNIQLTRKPIHLYALAIKFLSKNNLEITYENVKKLIKDDIKIRNKIRDFITSMEESIRSNYLDKQKVKFEDKKTFMKIMGMKFADITKKENDIIFTDIRCIRNFVSHIGYSIIYGNIDEIIEKLKKIGKEEFIDKVIFESLMDGIDSWYNYYFTINKI